jgi:hypothetical protein
VIRCAKIFKRRMMIDNDEAMSEAVLLATSDDLYTTEISRVDEQNNLIFDLEPTFPVAIRDQGELRVLATRKAQLISLLQCMAKRV